MMFCTSCGKEIKNDSKFCVGCGKEVINAKKKDVTCKITFHRVSRFFGCAATIKVFVDGELVGSISNNGTLEKAVSAGTHKISFSLWSGANLEEITVTEKEPNVYVDIKLKMGLITNSTEIVSIRREK